MKVFIKKYIAATVLGVAAVGMVSSCASYLDRPPYIVTPEEFFKSDADLFAYSIARYGMFPTNSGYNIGTLAVTDNSTDNQMVQNSMGTRYIPGEWKVGQSGGTWHWGNLYTINYFIRTVMPRYAANEITGNMLEAKHAIGEMYFFRAYFYFDKLQTLGDAPIIYEILKDEKEMLLNASERKPRHLVARMILNDLDSAFSFMYETPTGGKNRLTPAAVKLFRSRVALYEGTWEKNFANTAYVPGGPGYPGKKEGLVYNNATEVDFFLGEAMKDAKYVADKYKLATNPANYDYTRNDGTSQSNYFEMFGTINQGLHQAQFEEVLLYRAYNTGQQIAHYTGSYLINGGSTGFTQQFMDAFVMRNGLPIYAQGSGYLGDDSVNMMKIGRDSRFQIFVKGQGDILNDGATNKEPYKVPLFDISEQRATTGYMIKKGISRDPSQTNTGSYGTTGSIIFRAAEAYLNYIEACYEKNGALDGDAANYWRQIRERANINSDYNVTIAATDMSQEAQWDLGAYTAGTVIDPMRYNIRRERRCEFIAEGMRFNDLMRWRSMDQLATTKFMPLGFNFWSSMKNRYTPYSDPTAKDPEVTEPTPAQSGSVSAQNDPYSKGKYLVPLRLSIANNNLYKEGISWHPAHYLAPIAASHFLDATPTAAEGQGADLSKTKIYQNPGWGLEANTLPVAVGGF